MSSSASNNQTGHLAGLNLQRDRQAKIDAESRIRVVIGQHEANLDEVMVAEPNSSEVRAWRKRLRSHMVGEWTAVYQKAWEKCRGTGLAVWHERNDVAELEQEEQDLGDIQITNFQSDDMEGVPGVQRAMSDSTDFGDNDHGEVEEVLRPQPASPELEPEVMVTTAEPSPSISELVSIVDVLSRTAACGGMSVLHSEVLEKALRALHARL
jgi:hypothetical protein